MREFEAEKGFIHLVFGQEDEYYLKSLVCLNMNQFLYYQLKKAYEGIYFISGSQEEYQLEIPDEKACEYYGETEDGGWIDWLFSSKKQSITPGEKKKIPKSQEESFRQKIFRILRKRKQQAFVFTIESFYDLFQEEEAAEELWELRKKCLGKNILLIQAPPTAAGSLPYLEDKRGFFASRLFPEIFNQQSSRYEKIYTRIQETMGDRCCYLNKLGNSEIRWMLRRYLLEEKNLGAGKLYLADAYADFIYAWYHSEALREETGPVLPENEKRLIGQIRRGLDRPGTFSKIEDWIFRYIEDPWEAEGVLSAIQKEFPMDQEENYIYADSQLLRRVNSAPVPRGRLATGSCREKMFKLRRELRIPRLGQQRMEQNPHISFCVKQLQEAGAKGDIQTYEKALDALEYGICRAENIGETAEEIWKIKETIIRISDHVWTIGEQIEKDRETIVEFSENKENLQREIRELETKGREITKSGLLNIQKSAGNKISGDKLILNAKKDAALRMKEEIDNRQKQSAVNLQIKNGYNDQIRKMEQTAAQILLGNFSIDDYEIDTIAEKFQQNLLANMEAVQRGKDSADQVRKIIEETGSRVESQMDQQEIERRYRLLIEEEMEEKKEERGEVTC